MPSADSNCHVRRVSSHAITGAAANVSRTRGDASPRFPSGVATTYSCASKSMRAGLYHKPTPRAQLR